MDQGLVIPDLKGRVYADVQLQSNQMAQECGVGNGRE